MTRAILAALVLPLWLAASPAPAQQEGREATPAPVREWLGAARLRGAGLLRFWGFAVYDARLWVAGAEPDTADLSRTPLALELRYRREFRGADIARRSLDEMQDLGLAPPGRRAGWLATMESLFPDVREGDRLLGLIDARGHARFFHNDLPAGHVDDPAFAHAFFSIWLSERTSAPALRDRLLGAPAGDGE